MTNHNLPHHIYDVYKVSGCGWLSVRETWAQRDAGAERSHCWLCGMMWAEPPSSFLISFYAAAATLRFPHCRKMNKIHSNSFKHVGAHLMRFHSCVFFPICGWLWLLVLQLPPASLLIVWEEEKYKGSSLIIVLSSLTTIWHLSRRCRVKTVKLFFRGSYSRQKPGNIIYLPRCSNSPKCCAAKSAGQIKLCFCFIIEMMKAPENNNDTKCKPHFLVPSSPLKIFIQLSLLPHWPETLTKRNLNLRESKFTLYSGNLD